MITNPLFGWRNRWLRVSIVAALIAVGLGLGIEPVMGQDAAESEQWISLFNGKNLDGWTPKIRNYELGDNFADTFRVEDGVMKVSYDGYEDFDERFGHIFYKTAYGHYRFRVE